MRAALEVVASDVRAWFEAYLDTFRGLGCGERTDLKSILGFYGVPLAIVTDGRYVALPDRAAVLGTTKHVIDQLIRAGYAGGAVHKLDVRPLNARAALVEGAFSRIDRSGVEFERVDATYLALKTDDGWRITSIVLTAP